MAIPWDLDLPIFVWSMLRAIKGRKKRASQTPQSIPVDPEYQEVPEEELTQIQRHYLRLLDEQLAALNYRPDCTYRTTNYKNLGKNLVRRYVNAGDSASCGLKIVELKVKVGDAEAVKTSATVAFTTRFTDGKVLTTCNLPLKTLRDQPPRLGCTRMPAGHADRRVEATPRSPGLTNGTRYCSGQGRKGCFRRTTPRASEAS
ncbi:MAG TPA: hypothetical protein VEJ47_15835 [Candidatus Eremiobacteraceae bacterium]|nr:hypothetical protein [Candidatus Eremiobacteraceae bacterium]